MHWIERIASFQSFHDVHVVVDDSPDGLDDVLTKTVSKVPIHFVNASRVREDEYHGTSFVIRPENVMAWEKALWLHKQGTFSNTTVWFVEQDVFIPCANTLFRLDEAFPSADLVTAAHLSETADKKWCWWRFLKMRKYQLPTPWFHSLGCARRVSFRLLDALHEFMARTEHQHELPFHEILFNTLAHHLRFEIATPDALDAIQWNTEWADEEITAEKLFHPVKDLTQQERLWDRFKAWGCP